MIVSGVALKTMSAWPILRMVRSSKPTAWSSKSRSVFVPAWICLLHGVLDAEHCPATAPCKRRGVAADEQRNLVPEERADSRPARWTSNW